MAGMVCVSGRHVWQGVCMAGVCVVGACIAGETATVARGTHLLECILVKL